MALWASSFPQTLLATIDMRCAFRIATASLLPTCKMGDYPIHHRHHRQLELFLYQSCMECRILLLYRQKLLKELQSETLFYFKFLIKH